MGYFHNLAFDAVVFPPVVEPVVLVVEPVLPEVLVVPVVLLVLLVPVEPVVPVELVVELEVVPLSSFFLSFLQLVASNKDSENAPAIKTTFGVCDVFIGSFFCLTV